MRIFRNMDEIEGTFFPEDYERKRRAGLSPRELGTEDASRCLEKIKREVEIKDARNG